jgi:hypothetical protein
MTVDTDQLRADILNRVSGQQERAAIEALGVPHEVLITVLADLVGALLRNRALYEALTVGRPRTVEIERARKAAQTLAAFNLRATPYELPGFDFEGFTKNIEAARTMLERWLGLISSTTLASRGNDTRQRKAGQREMIGRFAILIQSETGRLNASALATLANAIFDTQYSAKDIENFRNAWAKRGPGANRRAFPPVGPRPQKPSRPSPG